MSPARAQEARGWRNEGQKARPAGLSGVLTCADCNGDAHVDIVDALVIAQHSAGVPVLLVCC